MPKFLKSTMIILLSSNKNILKQYIPPGSMVGFIPTASEPDDDRWYMEKDRKDLKQMGYELVSINIAQESKSTILNKLNAIDALFVAGGNSFYLLQELQKKDLLKELVNFAHNKTYVGSSAGACIACPSIDYAEKLDDKSRAPHLHDCAAMNIVNFFILPHYGNKEKYTKLADEIESTYKNRHFIKLSNHQAIIVKSQTDYNIIETP